jgi:uncharacterized protein YjbJ (UPF0337 family)
VQLAPAFRSACPRAVSEHRHAKRVSALRALGNDPSMKTARRNKAEGTLDKLAGRALEVISKVTGRRSTKAKGKAARTRGAGRKATGTTKSRAQGKTKGRAQGRTKGRAQTSSRSRAQKSGAKGGRQSRAKRG